MSSILCMQLLHWICVYCGCVSILNCKTSQSEIYLTAKTVGEAEEDTEALSFKTRRMDSPRTVPAFAFFFFCFGSVRAGQPGRSMGHSDRSGRRTCSNGTSARARAGRTRRRGQRRETLECHTLLKGYWLSTYCSISCSALPGIEKPLKTSYTVVLIPFDKTVPHKMY